MPHSQTACAATFEVLDIRFRCSPRLWIFIRRAATVLLFAILAGMTCLLPQVDLATILKHLP